MRYQVTWQVDGAARFGIYVDPDVSRDAYEEDDAQEALRAGHVIVEDAITGEPEWVRDDALTDIESSFSRELGKFDDPYSAYVEREFEQARNRSETLEHFGVGALIQVPVGDGRAYYVVTKLNKRTCVIDWRGFSGDRWHDQVLGWGGRFDLERIKALWEGDRALAELFGRRGRSQEPGQDVG